MSREAFEKWFTGEEDTKTRSALMALDAKGFYVYEVAYNAWNAWQACEAEQSKRIAELVEALQYYEEDIKIWCDYAQQEITHVSGHIAREALAKVA
jgi:hypothetical protein